MCPPKFSGRLDRATETPRASLFLPLAALGVIRPEVAGTRSGRVTPTPRGGRPRSIPERREGSDALFDEPRSRLFVHLLGSKRHRFFFNPRQLRLLTGARDRVLQTGDHTASVDSGRRRAEGRPRRPDHGSVRPVLSPTLGGLRTSGAHPTPPAHVRHSEFGNGGGGVGTVVGGARGQVCCHSEQLRGSTKGQQVRARTLEPARTESA